MSRSLCDNSLRTDQDVREDVERVTRRGGPHPDDFDRWGRPIPDERWKVLVELGFVEEAIRLGSTEELMSWINKLWGMSRTGSSPLPNTDIHVNPALSGRADLIAEMLVAPHQHDPAVTSFRNQHLPGENAENAGSLGRRDPT